MKTISIMMLLLLPATVFAQTQQDAQKAISHKRYVTAETTVKDLIRTQPQNTENWFWLSQVYLQKKDSATLVSLKSQLPGGFKNDPWLSVTMGNIELASGNAAGARHHFENAVSLTRSRNTDILAAIARANIYSNNGDKAYAIDRLEKALKRSKKNAALHTLIGEAHFRLKNGNEAYKALTRAVEFDPNYAPAYYALGMIFTTQHNEPVYLGYFQKAIAADAAFAPALYQLYYHYYSKDIGAAYDYFTRYMKATDPDLDNEYQLADMLYLTKRYPEALAKVNDLLNKQEAKNRLYKLKAYIYKETGAPDSAASLMNRYFTLGADTNFLLKDYEFMTAVYTDAGMEDSAVVYYERSIPLMKDEARKSEYFKKIADHYKEKKDYLNQSLWLAKYYEGNPKATNVDLFNWGLSLYQSQQYILADSVFGQYAQKYPEHVFGYYWQARTNAAMDSTMERGTAIPLYRKLIEVAAKDTANETNKRYLVEAYGYIAAYTANQEKNYTSAINYFEKLLELDPANNDARKYIEILEDAVDPSNGSKN